MTYNTLPPGVKSTDKKLKTEVWGVADKAAEFARCKSSLRQKPGLGGCIAETPTLSKRGKGESSE
ncbi:MAG: hypothetical protein JW915_21090 [Chitinispirillaceae bacterium]|nr:hypothetical protein [Chitinispirillaceae bacterium]